MLLAKVSRALISERVARCSPLMSVMRVAMRISAAMSATSVSAGVVNIVLWDAILVHHIVLRVIFIIVFVIILLKAEWIVVLFAWLATNDWRRSPAWSIRRC